MNTLGLYRRLAFFRLPVTKRQECGAKAVITSPAIRRELSLRKQTKKKRLRSKQSS
jgi:hypothetical protein